MSALPRVELVCRRADRRRTPDVALKCDGSAAVSRALRGALSSTATRRRRRSPGTNRSCRSRSPRAATFSSIGHCAAMRCRTAASVDAVSRHDARYLHLGRAGGHDDHVEVAPRGRSRTAAGCRPRRGRAGRQGCEERVDGARTADARSPRGPARRAASANTMRGQPVPVERAVGVEHVRTERCDNGRERRRPRRHDVARQTSASTTGTPAAREPLRDVALASADAAGQRRSAHGISRSSTLAAVRSSAAVTRVAQHHRDCQRADAARHRRHARRRPPPRPDARRRPAHCPSGRTVARCGLSAAKHRATSAGSVSAVDADVDHRGAGLDELGRDEPGPADGRDQDVSRCGTPPAGPAFANGRS